MWPNKGWVYNDGNVPNNNINQNSLPALPFADPDDTEQVLVPMSSMQAQQFIQSRTGEGYSNFQSPLSVSDRLMFQQDQVAPNAMTQVSSTTALSPSVDRTTRVSPLQPYFSLYTNSSAKLVSTSTAQYATCHRSYSSASYAD